MDSRWSKNLTKAETACKCGCGLNNMDLRLILAFEISRAIEGNNPLTPNSVCRCKNHNEQVQHQADPDYEIGSFKSNSKHMYGLAMDLPSKSPARLYRELDKLIPGQYGLICYDWGVHIDVADRFYRSDRRTK